MVLWVHLVGGDKRYQLFAAATTVYILVGIQFEEHDLVRFLGKDYEDYRRRVPMLIPFLGARSPRKNRA